MRTGRHRRMKLLVHVHVVEPEGHVLGVERVPVRPLHAGPQAQGDGAVVGRLVHPQKPVGVPGFGVGTQLHRGILQPVGGEPPHHRPVHNSGVHLSAVAPDLLDRHHDQRFVGYSLDHRRQGSAAHHLRQHRCFAQGRQCAPGGGLEIGVRAVGPRPLRRSGQLCQHEDRRQQQSGPYHCNQTDTCMGTHEVLLERSYRSAYHRTRSRYNVRLARSRTIPRQESRSVVTYLSSPRHRFWRPHLDRKNMSSRRTCTRFVLRERTVSGSARRVRCGQSA